MSKRPQQIHKPPNTRATKKANNININNLDNTAKIGKIIYDKIDKLLIQNCQGTNDLQYSIGDRSIQ